MGASHAGNKTIIKSLLNTFNENEKDKSIEYVGKENDDKKTALHFASNARHEDIVKLLGNVIGKDNAQLMKSLMKENKDKHISLDTDTYKEGNQQNIELVS